MSLRLVDENDVEIIKFTTLQVGLLVGELNAMTQMVNNPGALNAWHLGKVISNHIMENES